MVDPQNEKMEARLRFREVGRRAKLALNDRLRSVFHEFRLGRMDDGAFGVLPVLKTEVVERYSRALGVPIAPHDLRRTFAKLAHRGHSPVEQIQLSLGHASLHTTERYLGLEQDLVVARAFLVEFDALGPPARERRRVALRGIAGYLRHMHEGFRASEPSLAPPFADEMYLGIVYIARQLACDALDEQPRPDLRAIGEVLAAWLLPLYRPGEAAPSSTDVGASWQRSAR